MKGLLKSPLFADHKNSALFRKEVVGPYFQRKRIQNSTKQCCFLQDTEIFRQTEAVLEGLL